MRRGFGPIFAVAILFATIPNIMAQVAPSSGTAEGTPDLSGNWNRRGTAGGEIVAEDEDILCGPGHCGQRIPVTDLRRAQLNRTGVTEEPPMLPWAAEKYWAAQSEGADPDNFAGRDDLDPAFSGCFPEGPTRMMGGFELLQFPDVVLLLFQEDHWVRRVYMDGRGHPDDYPVTWMGHSIGKYDGDVLVVDTIKINDKTWIDNQGYPHTAAMHLLERFRRVDQKTLEYEFTIDDPEAYTKPWTGKKVYGLRPADYEVWEHVACEELLEIGKKRRQGGNFSHLQESGTGQ